MNTSVVDYYQDTGMDYAVWSREFNMHFGYWRWGLNPLLREPMLEEMNRLVFSLLQLEEGLVYDMGCGLGATMRSLARKYPQAQVTGLTLVPWQVERATTLNAAWADRLHVRLCDYQNSGLPSASCQAAYALESCCHAAHEDKGAFLAEMHRLLQPGSRFVIVDGFTLTPTRPRHLQRLIDYACGGWALPCFPSLQGMLERLRQLGFEDLKTRDLSWRIAPSVMHSAPTVVGFLLKRMAQGQRLNKVRLAHLWACLVSLLIGMHRAHFGYLLISGRKAGGSTA